MAHIKLENVNINIPVYDANALRLFRRSSLGTKGKVGSHNFNSDGVLKVLALNNFTMHCHDGDRIGLIGHNGAGKTTLLRYMAGIYPVEGGVRDIEGTVYMYGGTNAINPDATGYENVLLAMRLGGLPFSQKDTFAQDVLEFTELGEYLHMPARIYSAGMLARLSFAIATLYTPEILLIDEGIGAGDAQFAKKVEQRITAFTDKAKIIVCASHSNSLLQQLCNRGVVLNGGEIVFQGEINEALDYYANGYQGLNQHQAA